MPRKIIPESSAREESAITQRSVLLSTITRKAPIPEVIQRRSVDRQMIIQLCEALAFPQFCGVSQDCSISFFLC
jgi:hypothetical protein